MFFILIFGHWFDEPYGLFNPTADMTEEEVLSSPMVTHPDSDGFSSI